MGDKSNWKNLPKDLLIDIIQRFHVLEDSLRFSAVCKSWKAALEQEKLYLPLECPWLLLGVGKNIDTASRSIFSLSRRNIYDIVLPEVSRRVIIGTSKSWLVTLDKDFEISLLHPFLRKQIPLPPLHTLTGFNYKRLSYTRFVNFFVRKVALSSTSHESPTPTVMVIYGAYNILCFARSGDREWSGIDIHAQWDDIVYDIVYHKGKFYVVDFNGNIFKCDIDNNIGVGGATGTKISSPPITTPCASVQKYLIESLSGSHLFLLFRFRKGGNYDCKYYTDSFMVWKLELQFFESSLIPSCTWTEVHNLGDQAIFVGKTSSTSIPSSENIKPNCIYFTGDMVEFSDYKEGGQHDMEIFNLESATIEPHFRGSSIHPASPDIWFA